MVPISTVLAYGALAMLTTASAVAHSDFHHTQSQCIVSESPQHRTLDKHYSLHEKSLSHHQAHANHVHESQRRMLSNIQAIEAMAALNPVLPTAEALGRLAVVHTYDCKLTAYSAGFESTGKNPGDPGYGITATGKMAKPRHTIAVDPNLIPLGSLVYIDGIGYRVAEDIGGAIKGSHIDVFYPDENDAKIFGVKKHVKVYVFGHNRQNHRA